jgi:hypothetical protein
LNRPPRASQKACYAYDLRAADAVQLAAAEGQPRTLTVVHEAILHGHSALFTTAADLLSA